MPARENRNLSSDIGVIRTFKFIQNKPHFVSENHIIQFKVILITKSS